MVMLDAFPFDNDLEIVENICMGEDRGYYYPLAVPVSDYGVPGSDIKEVTKRGRGRRRKNWSSRRASKRATEKPKQVGRKPALVVPDISDPIERNDSVKRSLRNRGKVLSYRSLREKKHFSSTDKRNVVEAVSAGMSVKKGTRIYTLPECVVRIRQKEAICRVDVENDSYSSRYNTGITESGNFDGTSVPTDSQGDDETPAGEATRVTRSKVKAFDSHDSTPRKNRLGRVKEPISTIGDVPVKRAAEIHNMPTITLKRKLKLGLGSTVKDNNIIAEAIRAVQAGRMSIARAAAFYRIPRTSLGRRYKLEVGNVVKERCSNGLGGDPGCLETNGAIKERFRDPEGEKDGTTNDLNQLRDQDNLKTLRTEESDGLEIGACEPVRNQSSDNRSRLRDREQLKVDDYFSTPDRKKYTRKSYSPHSLRKAVESYRAGISMVKAAFLHNVSLNFLGSKLREAGLLPSTSRTSTVESHDLKVDYTSVSEPPKSRKLDCDDFKEEALLSEIENHDQVWNTPCPSHNAGDSGLTGPQDMLAVGGKGKDLERTKDRQESMTVSVSPQPPLVESVKECEVPDTPLGNTPPWKGEVNGCSSVEGGEVPATSMISHSGAQTDETGHCGGLVDDISTKAGKTDCSERPKKFKNPSDNDDLGSLDDRAKTDETNNVRRLRSSKKPKIAADDQERHFNEDGSMIEPKITGYLVRPRIHKLYTQEMLSVALEDLKAGRMSCKEAAEHYCIPYGSLWIKYKVLRSGLPASRSSDCSNCQLQDQHHDPYPGLNETNTNESFGPSVKRGPGRPRKTRTNSSSDLGGRNDSETVDDSSERVKHLSDVKSSDTNEAGGSGHPSHKAQKRMSAATRPDKFENTDYLRRLRARKTIKMNTCDHPNHWKSESLEQPKNTSFGPESIEQNPLKGFEMEQEDTGASITDHYNIQKKHQLTGLNECLNGGPLASPSNVTSILEQFGGGSQNCSTNGSSLDERGATFSFSEMREDKSQVLSCASCGYETHLKSNLKRHVVKHLPENWLKCPKCDFAEENAVVFYKHYLCHDEHQREVYPCPYCRFTSWKGWYLARHVNYHRKYPDMYDCRECDFSTAMADCLVRHELMSHPRDRDKIERTGNSRHSEQTDEVNGRVNGGLVGSNDTGVGASSHKQYMEGLKMALEDMKAGRMSCSEAALHYNIPYVTLLNKQRLNNCRESGPSGSSPNKSSTLEQSVDGQSVNQNSSTNVSVLEETVPGECAGPTIKRGRGRPPKGTGRIKRKRGRPRKLTVTRICSPEKLPLANACRPNADNDLTVPGAFPPCLDNVPTKPQCSDLNMPSHHEMKESLEDQEKIKCLSHVPAAAFPELQAMDTDCHPLILEEPDRSQHQASHPHPSSTTMELQTENLVCPVDSAPQVPLDTLQGCCCGSRNAQEPDIASSQSKQENPGFRDPTIDCSTDHKIYDPHSSAAVLLQPGSPSHSSYTQRPSELSTYEGNAQLPAPEGLPVLDMLPVYLVVERTSHSDTVDSSELCPIPGMPVLSRAPPESDLQILPGIPEGETLSCSVDSPVTTESFPAPPVLIPVSPVQSAIMVPAAPARPPTPKSP